MALPLIQKDTNLMRQTLKKIVKAMQARKKVVSTSKTTPVITKTKDSGATTGDLETEKEEPKKEKNPIEKLIESVKETFDEIKKSITKTLKELPGKIIDGIVKGMKSLFTAGKIAGSVLSGFFKSLLGFLISPLGLGLILATGLIAGIYNLIMDYRAGSDRKSRLRFLRMLRDRDEATPEQLEELERLESAGVTSGPGEARQLAAQTRIFGSKNVIKFLKEIDESNNFNDEEKSEEISKQFGLPADIVRKFANEFKKNPKLNLLDYAKSSGIASTHPSAKITTRPVTQAQKEADYFKNTKAFGDDKALQLIESGKIDGDINTAKKGINTYDVLSLLEEYYDKEVVKNKNPTPLANKTVYLSTGLENTKDVDSEDYKKVENQINLLNKMGASQIKILGVSPKHEQSSEINKTLYNFTSKSGKKYEFIGVGATPLLSKESIKSITDYRSSDEIQADFEKKNMRVTGENIKETQLITESKNIITPYEYDASVYGEDNSLGESMRKSMSPNDTQGLVPPGPALIGRIESPFNPIQKQFASYGSLTLITIG